ncbi:MAG: hypothetical protein WC796_01710 [Candidatus Pacearchaeota archaeon]|jgi:hypothetical protein
MNKRGDDLLIENLVVVVVVIVFFGMLLFFVARSSSGGAFLGQYYSKQVGVLIDGGKPGTQITLDVSDAYKVTRKNNFDYQKMVKFEDNNVLFMFGDGKEYKFHYFSDVEVEGPVYSILGETKNPQVLLNFKLNSKKNV